MNNVEKTKRTYVPPELEMYEFEVEQGYAASQDASNLETFNEIVGTDEQGNNEVYHGEWY